MISVPDPEMLGGRRGGGGINHASSFENDIVRMQKLVSRELHQLEI